MTSNSSTPVLKLNTSRQSSFSALPVSTPQMTGDTPKIKLKVGSSQLAAPALSTPVPSIPVIKTKAGRAMKPTAKLLESRKRANDDIEDSDEDFSPAGFHARPPKKIKLAAVTPSARPGLKVIRSDFPQHIPGDGYDSCASDIEDDVEIHEQVILRLQPGPDCDYVNECLRAKKTPGTTEFSFDIKFLEEGRRLLVRVRSQLYAAYLLDLPTVTESMKSWDRKAFVKSVDICQMILVHTPVENEHQALAAPLPSILGGGQRWPHGLTPPMHDCINRRFRKIPSKKESQSKEDEVNRLLELDDEWDDSQLIIERPEYVQQNLSDGQDLENVDGYFESQNGQLSTGSIEIDDMDAFEQMLFNEMVPSLPEEADGQSQVFVEQEHLKPMKNSENNSVDENHDDDEEDDASDLGSDQSDPVWEEIRDLEAQLQDREEKLAEQKNEIFIQRLKANIKTLKNDIEVKKASIGISDTN